MSLTYNKNAIGPGEILGEHRNLRWLCLICGVPCGSIKYDYSNTRRTSLLIYSAVWYYGQSLNSKLTSSIKRDAKSNSLQTII